VLITHLADTSGGRGVTIGTFLRSTGQASKGGCPLSRRRKKESGSLGEMVGRGAKRLARVPCAQREAT
jgi:hypothetical protein